MNLVAKRYWFFLISAIIIVPGIISMLIPPAFRPGIEFSSGSALTITFTEPVSEAEIREQLSALGHPEALIQRMGDRTVFIRTVVLKEAVVKEGEVVTPSEREQIEKALSENVAPIESREYDTVTPVVARETVRNAAIAVVFASVAILLYITWAFRKVPNPFRYGVCAILALIHDLLVVMGIFSILGKAMNMEVNAMFITGLLTVMGYSVHDTIVVFDRIRENITRGVERQLEGVINTSVLETMGRSLNTSLTSLFTLLALILLGGPTIRGFLLVLLIGIITGTYSSICIASQFLVVWEKGEFLKLLRFLRLAPARTS